MSRAIVIVFASLAFCVAQCWITAEEPRGRDELAKGTKAVLVKLAKGRELPEGVVPGMAVDVVGEFSEPVKTGVALVNVRLLAVDTQDANTKQPLAVTVQVTPAQAEVLALMQKHKATIVVKLHEKHRPKK